jgi:predicted phosphohydrolase
MRILVTSDLHYNHPRSRKLVEKLAKDVLAVGGDVLLLLGDTAGNELEHFRKALKLFAPFPGRKLAVAGNHCIWTFNGTDSWKRYREVLPAVCSEYGFHLLDDSPVVVDDTAFVGIMGWYDYSFRMDELEIPLRFYRHKVSPGAAQMLPEHSHLVSEAEDVPARHSSLRVRWMDGRNVRLPFSDEEFTRIQLEKLQSQIDWAKERADRIVAGMHHVPFKQMLRATGDPQWDFAHAFMGAERFGEVLAAEPKVSKVFCGHSHRRTRYFMSHPRRNKEFECVNVGSTYIVKRFETVDLL